MLRPCISSIPATMATLFIGLLGDNKGGWGKRLTSIHKIGNLTHLIIKILLYLYHCLVSIHMGHRFLSFFFCPHKEFCLYASSQISLLSTFKSCPFQVSDNLAKLLVTVHESIYDHTSGHFSFQQSEQPAALLKVLSTWRISLHFPSGMSQKGA